MVSVLNGIFTLAVDNFVGVTISPTDITGNPDLLKTARGIADQFFLSIMYIVVVYLIGISCFKLIDLLPDGVMRWISTGVASFGKSDIADDELDKLQYELPAMTQSMVHDFGNMITDSLYKPGAEIGMEKLAARQAEAQKAAQKAAQEAANNKQNPKGGQ